MRKKAQGENYQRFADRILEKILSRMVPSDIGSDIVQISILY